MPTYYLLLDKACQAVLVHKEILQERHKLLINFYVRQKINLWVKYNTSERHSTISEDGTDCILTKPCARAGELQSCHKTLLLDTTVIYMRNMSKRLNKPSYCLKKVTRKKQWFWFSMWPIITVSIWKSWL